MHSDDNDMDGMLSECDSDNNEFGEDFDDETDEILARIGATMRENIYIPNEDLIVFRIGQYFRNFK